ncbi:MAG: NADH-quinone oxidoreductase subunit N [Chloroflexota bacterium]
MNSSVTLDWFLTLLPEISLVILLAAILIYDRGLNPSNRRNIGLLTAWGAFFILLLTLGVWLFLNIPDTSASLQESLYWGGMIRNDLITLIFRVMFLSALLLVSLITVDTKRLQRGEFFALLVAATIGFSLMGASADLIMIYVALETASISSYLLAGYKTEDDLSTEAGIKYFIYGAFATAVMLYGMSFIYGLFGETNIYAIGSSISTFVAQNGSIPAEANGLLLLAALLIIVGLGFKISAVPLHFWTPDVYHGSPTSFTAFVSTASKAAGFAVFLRVFDAGVLGVPDKSSYWWAMLVAICVVTMTLGNMAAIFQKNLKRLLAYSSIAQAGYAMIGLVVFTPDGSAATMFYLLMYVFTNMAAFGVIILISNVSNSDDLKDLYGLNRRSPYLALAMLFALLSLGGIPPTAGFIGKFFLFKAAVEAGLWWLALIGILNAFIALYYYLTIVKYMYLYRSDEEAVAIPVSRAAQIGLAISTALIIILGIYAGPAFDWTREAANAFFPFIG